MVSYDQSRWLPRCLATLQEHAASLDLDVVVVDNGPHEEVGELPGARVIRVENRGYGNANNVGLAASDTPWVLFLNPDTEFLDGSLAALVESLESRPDVGIAGVRQVDASGALTPTMRSFPSALRTLGDALGLERLPSRPDWLGERELRLDRYEQEFEGDWTIGSFLLARRNALEAVGGFDESFFLFSEETDLCWRIHRDGWRVVHIPDVTIRHFEQEHGSNPRLWAQSAFARLQFARKNLRHPRAYRAALALRYGARTGLYSLPGRGDPARRDASRAALAAVIREEAPLA